MGNRKKKWYDIGLKHAANGIWQALVSEKNLKIHTAAIVIVITLAVWLSTSSVENAVLALTVGLVIAAELINTAIEKAVNISCDDILSNELKKDPVNNNAKLAKNISAGAVLFAAIIAVIVGAIIFIPRILDKIF